MSEFIQNFHFLRPYYLIGLIIPIVLSFLFFKKKTANSNWQEICDKKILDFLLISNKYKAKNILNIAIIFAYVLSIIAIAGPVWNKVELPNLVKNNVNMIVLDMSSDMKKTDITPNRLERAKFQLYELLDNSTQTQFGLIVYSDEPFLITPITQDKNLVKNLIKNIDFSIMPEDGKRLDRAIELAIEKIKLNNINESEITVVASDIGDKINLVFNAGKKAKIANAKINIVGLDKLNSDGLKSLASIASGKFVEIENIKSLYNQIDKDLSSDLVKDKTKSEIWLDYGYVLIPFIMIVTAMLFRKSILIILLFLMISNPSYAGFFTNNNQDGLSLYKDGKFEEALEKFDDEKYKANSLFKLGDYEKSSEIYEKFDDVKSQYNYATSIAKQGKVKEAIKLYEDYLKKNPSDEDAKFNLELLKKIPPQSSQSGQNKENQNNSDDDKDQKKNQKNKSDDNKQNKDKKDSDNKKNEEKNDSSSQSKTGDKKKEISKQEHLQLSEEEQAKKQMYREIEIDNSSLLKRFIQYEYMKNRYGDRR